MRVFHGSNYKFSKLEIHPELKKDTTLNNEGPGIYVSTSSKIAKSYGRYIYTIESPMVDFRDRKIIDNHVTKLTRISCEKLHRLNQTGIDTAGINRITYKLVNNIPQLVDWLYFSSIAFNDLDREIGLQLDSLEEVYMLNSIDPTSLIESVSSVWKQHLPKAYMFNYHIPNIGVIKNPSTSIIKNIKENV